VGHERYQLPAQYVPWAVALSIGMMLYQAFRPAEVRQSGSSIRVQGGLYQRLEVGLDQLQEVQLLDSLPPVGRRLAGYELGPRKRGRYEIAEWGTADLFLESRDPPFLLLRSNRTGTNTIITNLCDPADTWRAFGFVQQAVRERKLKQSPRAAAPEPGFR
jgi:hypothetical protein